MIEKYTIKNLTQDNAQVLKQTYIEYDGQQYPVGETWSRGYVNSIAGRQQIINELPQAQQNAMFAVWGDTPTVTENSDI